MFVVKWGYPWESRQVRYDHASSCLSPSSLVFVQIIFKTHSAAYMDVSLSMRASIESLNCSEHAQ